MKISFVTICMGRLDHLKQTLPLQQHPDCESIVVDWSCPDNCGDWVEANFPDAKVIRISNQQFFDKAQSVNIGISIATGDFICVADADVIIKPTLFDVLPTLCSDTYYVHNAIEEVIAPKKYSSGWIETEDGIKIDDNGLIGFIVFPRQALTRIGTPFQLPGYGGHDIEQRMRLLRANYKEHVDKTLVQEIKHSDDRRNKYLNNDLFVNKQNNYKEIRNKYGINWVTDVIKRQIRKNR